MWIKAALIASLAILGTAARPVTADPIVTIMPADHGPTIQVAGLAPGTVLKGISFTANTPDGQPSLQRNVLLWAMDTKEGQPYNPATLSHDLNRLFNRQNGLLRAAGFIADVGTDITYNPSKGVLVIPIVESHIAHFIITGNSKTTTANILGQMQSKPGEVYDNDITQHDMTRIFDMGAFDQVGPWQVEPTNVGQVDVTIPVVEKK